MSGFLAHRLLGERGDVVLLLNGGMMTHLTWAPVANLLVDRYRVLGCDFRGQLMTPGSSHQRLVDHVPDLVALLDHLALDRVHVLGTSFGGEVAVLLAAAHPERVRTLAAVTAADRTPSGMGNNSRRLRELAREVLAGGDAGAFYDAFIGDVYSPPWRRDHAGEIAERRARSAALPAAWFEGVLGILQAVESFDLTPQLGRVACPTLVVHAARDEVMPSERVHALAASIAGAELQIHPTSGHVLVFEDPQWLARTYLDFLARNEEAG